jgi:archaellum component FlaG (FlaF/FlaG flagellin family)
VTSTRRFGLAALTLIVVAAGSAIVTWSVTNVSGTRQPSSRVAECIQGQLQVAIEQGGGLAGTVPTTYGYTFLIVNTGAKSCEVHGYPYEVIFSKENGEAAEVSILHRRTVLYAQPKIQRVVLRPGGLASFGISYTYGIAPTDGEPPACLAPLVDVRLPALSSHLFSYEFPVRLDACEAGGKVEVTPVEGRAEPRA